jgi:hypothetical protein
MDIIKASATMYSSKGSLAYAVLTCVKNDEERIRCERFFRKNKQVT